MDDSNLKPTNFVEVMNLSKAGQTWQGQSSPFFWGRIYGGQVVAQALWAALQTVDEKFSPHSLHAYFIRAGEIDEPVEFRVDELRDGRSFCTRAVVASQSGGAILHLSCSFQVAETEAEVQTAKMPLAPAPEDCSQRSDHWPWIIEQRPMVSYHGAGKSMSWVRLTDELPDDPRLHACGLAYTSDSVQFQAASSLHPLKVEDENALGAFMGASLDHAVWFHRPMKATDWHLYAWDCHGLTGARAMTVGNLFSEDGTHVATIAQEVLIREMRH